jgi:hypothetical protein
MRESAYCKLCFTIFKWIDTNFILKGQYLPMSLLPKTDLGKLYFSCHKAIVFNARAYPFANAKDDYFAI